MNNINTVNPETIVNSVKEALKGMNNVTITVNVRSIWVKAPKRANKTLEKMGFNYCESKNAWWLTYAPTHTETPTTAKGKGKAKATDNKKSSYRKNQVKTELTEITEKQALEIKAWLEKIFPKAEVIVNGTWVRVKGEATREYAPTLKAMGFFWAPSKEKQYWTRPVAASWINVKPQVNSEPEAKTEVKAESEFVMTVITPDGESHTVKSEQEFMELQRAMLAKAKAEQEEKAEVKAEKAEPKPVKERVRAKKTGTALHQPVMSAVFA